MDNKSKKILLLTIIVLIIVSIGVFVLIKVINNKFKTDVIEYKVNTQINNELKKVNSKGYYYIVKNIVEKYYYSLCSLNQTTDDILIFEYDEEVEKLEDELKAEIEGTKKKIYNWIAEENIQESEISIDNIQEKLGNYKDLNVFIKNMYTRELSTNLTMYFVFGTIMEKDNSLTKDFKLMVMLDGKNSTFNIYTSDYIDKNNLYVLSQEKDFAMDITNVEKRTYNTYKYEYISDETYAEDLLKHYVQSIKYLGTDYSYEQLDEEYKEKRFKTKTEYKEYVDENKKRISTALLDYYQVEKYDTYTQYICVDRKGNYYIFKESATMDYSLLLDVYTVDLPEFIEKYNNAITEDKVKLNIEKVVEALNQKDYRYIYERLVEEYKESNFKTYEEFKKYAEKTFDIENEITYNQYTESKDYCTYKITLNGKNKTITKTIVMKLEEGTEFIMSFNVE